MSGAVRIPGWLADGIERVDALTTRERAIGFVVALGFLIYAWYAWLYVPLDARRDALESRVEQLRDQLAGLNQQTDLLSRTRSADPDAAARSRLGDLRAEADAVRVTLAGVLRHLVPPREMAKVLEAVLTRETGLRLVSLESLGAEPFGAGPVEGRAVDDAPAPGPGEAPLALYRHGLRVRFDGGYLEALAYLRALEALSWRFMWDSVTLAVTEHPASEVTVTVHSMSFDAEWMGV